MSEKSASKCRLIDIWKKEMKQNWKKYFFSFRRRSAFGHQNFRVRNQMGDTLGSCSGQAVARFRTRASIWSASPGCASSYCEHKQAVCVSAVHGWWATKLELASHISKYKHKISYWKTLIINHCFIINYCFIIIYLLWCAISIIPSWKILFSTQPVGFFFWTRLLFSLNTVGFFFWTRFGFFSEHEWFFMWTWLVFFLNTVGFFKNIISVAWFFLELSVGFFFEHGSHFCEEIQKRLPQFQRKF